jgi:hypothetical protein
LIESVDPAAVLATFYIANNLSMLSASSVVALLLVFTVPVTAGVALMNVVWLSVGR